DTHEVSRDQRQIDLTQREFELLEYLMRNERLVISRQKLLDEVWGYDPFSITNTIEVFVSNLRRKLEAGGEPRLLHTVRGSALLTLVILCGFAAIVGVLTTGRIQDEFNCEVVESADKLQQTVNLRAYSDANGTTHLRREKGSPMLEDYASAQNAAIRIITQGGYPLYATSKSPDFGPAVAESIEIGGWRVETRQINVDGLFGQTFVQYARRLSDVQATVNRVRLFLV